MSFAWQPLYRVFDHASDAGQTAIDQVPQAQPKPVLAKAEALRLIDAAAVKHNLAPAFVKSIVAVESNFDAATCTEATLGPVAF